MAGFKALNFQLGDFAPIDLYIVNTGGGVSVNQGTPTVEVVEEWLPRRIEPYVYGFVQNNPLEFEIEFSPLKEMNREKLSYYLKKISNNKNQYRELKIIQSDMYSVFYKVICLEANIVSYGGNVHVIRAKFRNKSGYLYESYNTVDLGTSFYNRSDYDGYLYPTVEFTVNTSGEISIENLTTGEKFAFNGLTVGESIIVDCDKQEIVSSLGLKRLDKFNGVWLGFVQGMNQLKLTNTNDCSITYQIVRSMGC